jgi:hypothetical protein
MSSAQTGPAEATESTLKRIDWELVTIHVILLLVAAFLFWVSSDLGRVPRRAPMFILATMMVLILADLGITLYQAAKNRTYMSEHSDKVDAPLRVQFAHIGGFVVCGLLIYNLGYRMATPIFLVGFLLAMRVKIQVLIPLALGSSLLIYVVFSEFLNIR